MNNIREAKIEDIDMILELLKQVNKVHYDLRPDLFKLTTKYSKEELMNIILNDKTKKIYVYEENNKVIGHIFIEFEIYENNQLLTDHKTIHIDDLCVDKDNYHKGIGKSLYLFIKEYAKRNNYNNITLNVWDKNEAYEFYKKLGLKIQKTTLEEIITD